MYMSNRDRIVSFFFVATALSLLSFRTVNAFPDRKAVMIAAWERAKAYTREYLDAATDEVYGFKPTPEIKSFAEQMHHLAVDNYKITSAAVVGVANPANAKDLEKNPPLMNKAEITRAVMESYDFVIATIKGIDESGLGSTVKMFNKWETTVEDGLNKAFEHQTHHRGQTTVYLRLKGITPPKEKLF